MSAISRPWIVRLRESWNALRQQASIRAERERRLPTELKQRLAQAEQEFAAARDEAEETFKRGQEEAEMLADSEREMLQENAAQQAKETKAEYKRIKSEITLNYRRQREEVENEFKETRWTLGTVFEADKKVAKDQLRQASLDSQALLKQMEQHDLEAVATLARWDLLRPDDRVIENESVAATADPWADLQANLDRSRSALQDIRDLRLPRWLHGYRPFSVMLILWGLIAGPLAYLEQPWFISAIVGATILFFGMIVRRQLHQRLVSWATAKRNELKEAWVHANANRRAFLDHARTRYRQRRKESAQKTQAGIREAVVRTKAQIRDLRKQRSERLAEAERTFPPRMKQILLDRDQQLEASSQTYRQAMIRLHSERESKLQAAGRRLRDVRDATNRHHADSYAQMLREWKQASDRLAVDRDQVVAEEHRWFHRNGNGNGSLPNGLPAGIPFGELRLDLKSLPDGLPQDRFLPIPRWQEQSAPACLGFPEKASLLLEAAEPKRASGIDLLKALLLRAWQALPPGRMRCTLIDPVGRGEHFAGFMHLADHDPQLVDHRIWTETTHIEERLAELTGHMETILQKYLRNQFATLAEYNAQAGELAEPFRFVVVADFPANFSKEAAHRLLSLASAGARAGIYVWVQADPTKDPPESLRWEDLEAACTVLHAGVEGWLWQDDDFSVLPLITSKAPSEEELSRALAEVGKKAVAAGRRQVPFDSIAPPPAERWTESSRLGLNVPLGKVGAGRPQSLALGQGTQQHVLVAGKTGSGKSTLLHVLIMQLSLRYSPNEVELYLIDFKKGVEFKTYASHALPHARVVAVESEREFGLSVLQSLDAELTRRGERFRDAGVNDLPSFRGSSAGADVRMPRIVLIVDEFQEFFVEDDKLSQESSLLLDRLVRQGRAFGIHVVLGSQTLGGAYGLARATLDQMAIRIALPCSEADAHLILSRENTEARLLSRPGEAIYNNAGGLLEGNQFFQVVWLEDGRRDQLLGDLRQLEANQGIRRTAPLAVFEGNRPADVAANFLLAAGTADEGQPTTWLGESLTLQAPPALRFPRHSGANLLLVGQQEERAFDVLFAAMLGLRKSSPQSEIVFVPGLPVDSIRQKTLEAFAKAAPIRLVGPNRIAELLTQWAAELPARHQVEGELAPRFVVLHGLHRIRDLRKPEDDLGIARRGEENLPHRVFGRILRDGPPAGIHVLAWCDNLANLQRTLDRNAIREFEMKVAFAMNPSDSSQFLDSPLAAKLGVNRAFLYREDQGLLEKFRPYGLPDAEWLKQTLEMPRT
jgi:S-DNA-T family DNA segregation ATPase FtsK/SpoIIIE